jgi:transposase
MLTGLGVQISRSTMLRVLMALPIPLAPTPQVLAVDDGALRRGHRYTAVIIDAVTHRRIDVLPDRKAAALADWLETHSGAQIVCRNGSATYAEAIRQGAPKAVQVCATSTRAAPTKTASPRRRGGWCPAHGPAR